MHIQGGIVPVKMSTTESIKTEIERRGEGREKRREGEGGKEGREKRREGQGGEEGRKKRSVGEREKRRGGEGGKRKGGEGGKRKGGEIDRGIIDHAQGAETDTTNTHETEATHMKGATDISCTAHYPLCKLQYFLKLHQINNK